MTYLITISLVLLSALFSGLTLGLMGLNVYEVKRQAELGDKYAKKIFPVRKNGNLLLTTLLLGNVAVNAALSIFLGSLASGFIAGLIATALIFLFGEIIPQAAFSRYAKEVGAKTAWLVRIIIFLLYPITKPIAWVLDKVLGEEMATVYSKKELVKIIEEHEDSLESEVDKDEEKIIKGALTFSEKRVEEVMTPNTVVLMIKDDQKLNKTLVAKLVKSGHSRFPVYSGNDDNIVRMLFLKDLVGKDTSKKTAKDLARKDVYFVKAKGLLDDVLNAFIKTKNHLFIVVDEFGGMEGIISIEDIMEEIIGREIVDEFDQYTDMRAVAKKKRGKNTI